MRFMMLMIPKGYENAAPGTMPRAEAVAAMMKYNEALTKAGRAARARRAPPALEGARVSFSGGKPTVTDGPFTEAKEVIGGYWMIQVKSKEEAIEWASRCPGLGQRSDRGSPGVRDGGLSAEFTARASRKAGRSVICAATAAAGLHRPIEDGVIGSRDGFRHPSRDRRGLEDRVGQAHRRSRADRARRRPGRGARAGRSRRRARAVAGVGRPGQSGRLAHGHREASRDRSPAPQQAARAQARGARPRARGPAGERAAPDLDAALDDDVGDDLLRLVFTACHPVLSTEARVALTLRLLGGLTTEEIARAFLVPEPTIAQRIVRAKRTLAEERVPFEVPRGAELAARLSSVLEVIYLIFNEGYTATAGDDWMRPALCEDALRLGRILAELVPQEPEVHGLVALMEIQASRSRARVGPSGEPILLLDQNRARWDQLLIRRGLAALERAEAARRRARPVRAAGRDRRLSRARAARRRRRTGRASRRSTPSSPSSRRRPSWS